MYIEQKIIALENQMIEIQEHVNEIELKLNNLNKINGEEFIAKIQSSLLDLMNFKQNTVK